MAKNAIIAIPTMATVRSPRALSPTRRRRRATRIVDPRGPSGLFPAFVGPAIAHSHMDQLLEFFHRLQDVKALIAWGGYVGLTTIIFAETGLLIGLFLPADQLLVTAGILASQLHFHVFLLGTLLSPASILRNTVGHYIGRVDA